MHWQLDCTSLMTLHHRYANEYHSIVARALSQDKVLRAKVHDRNCNSSPQLTSWLYFFYSIGSLLIDECDVLSWTASKRHFCTSVALHMHFNVTLFTLQASNAVFSPWLLEQVTALQWAPPLFMLSILGLKKHKWPIHQWRSCYRLWEEVGISCVHNPIAFIWNAHFQQNLRRSKRR